METHLDDSHQAVVDPEDLKMSIINIFKDHQNYGRRYVETAWEAGRLLNEAQAVVEDGYVAFLSDVGISTSQAGRFRALFAHFGKKELVEFTSLTAALKAIPPALPPGQEPTPDPTPGPTKDDKHAQELDAYEKRAEDAEKFAAGLEQERETLRLQVDAIKNDERPGLAGGVQEISSLGNQLSACKAERERLTILVKDKMQEINRLKRENRKLRDKQVVMPKNEG